MLTTVSESLKREAVDKVLQKLGIEMIEVIKFHLKRSYAISFDGKDGSTISLDQLHFGLSVMLGEGHANSLLRQITEEIKEIERARVAEA